MFLFASGVVAEIRHLHHNIKKNQNGIGKTIWKLFKGQERDFFSKLDSMSFGQPSSIEGIEGLRPSIYNSPKDSDWVNKDILWSAIGYNRKIAPIQMLTFYNAIANNGKMVKPTFVPGTA